MLGSWKINISVDGAPQKVATAISELNELVGAEYEFIAYLGSQVVNGTNHAVLCKQTLVIGKDVQNIVLVIFHETKEGVTVQSIERVVESGGELGGIAIDVKINDMPEEAVNALNIVLSGFVGSKVTPVAFLGSQVTKGTNYIFLAEVAPVVPEPESQVAIIVANPMTNEITFINFLESKQDVATLGYAFTWLK